MVVTEKSLTWPSRVLSVCLSVSLSDLFILMYIWYLVYMSVCMRKLEHLKLELQTDVSCHVGARRQTWVLCKSTRSELLNSLQSFHCLSTY